MAHIRTKYLMCLVLGIVLLGFFANAAQTDEELNKKYAPILGNYEFDMSEMGMGVMVVSIYVENGSLWALPESEGEAGEMFPVEGKTFEFTIENPDSTFALIFMKDENGEYTQCHAVNETMGMDMIGKKKK